MSAIRVVGHPKPEAGWLHRFRNLGEAVYVELRDRYAVSIEEIDAAVDTFSIRDVRPEDASAVADTLASLIREHHLDDSVFVLPDGAERPGCTVVLVLDPAFGERLWEVTARHPAWVVPSDVNRAAVEEMWEAAKRRDERSPVTIWSAPRPAVSEEDWGAMLDAIELHHGELASDPPVEKLNVYGAALSPAIHAALRAYDYKDVKSTGAGFIAFKRDPRY